MEILLPERGRDGLEKVLNMAIHTKFKSKEIHFQEIKKIQSIILNGVKKNNFKKIKTSNVLRNRTYKNENIQIDLSNFNGILDFNHEQHWILVEPKLSFFHLCKFTLNYNLIPPVVPEFKYITVGGAVMGAALESSSHIYGQVNDNCLEYELILGNGEIITASASKNADLFYGCSGSYGTVGILTAVKLQLIESKKWIKLTYYRFQTPYEAAQMLTCPLKDDFAEGIVYSPSHAVVITGKMIDNTKNLKSFRQNYPWSPWYVQHVLKGKIKEECMNLEEYLFRHDRGAFWMGGYINSFKTMFKLLLNLGIPKIKQNNLEINFFFRFLFCHFFSSKNLYQLWHRIPTNISEKIFFIHDFYAPIIRSNEVLSYFIEQTKIFPIWLCPIKGAQTPQFLSPHFGNSNYLNIGIYGIPQSNCPVPALSAKLENKIITFGGRKMLYSFTYYDLDSFAKIYKENLYNELRKKFFAENVFPSLYNKIVQSKEEK